LWWILRSSLPSFAPACRPSLLLVQSYLTTPTLFASLPQIVNLDLAKAVLRNSPDVKRSYGMTSPSARSSISSMSRQKLLDSARKSARESAKGGMSGRSGLSGRSGKTDRSSGSAGATAIRLLQEQLGDERKRREKAEKELEELRATERKGGEEKGEEEELRKFRNFKASGGIIDP